MSGLSRRRFVLATGGAGLGLLAGCGRLPGQASTPEKMPRVGIVAAAQLGIDGGRVDLVVNDAISRSAAPGALQAARLTIVDEADVADRTSADLRCQLRDFIISRFRRAIHDVEPEQGIEPLRFVGGDRNGQQLFPGRFRTQKTLRG